MSIYLKQKKLRLPKNDKVDVVVERESLTETEIAQIEDIVTRKTDVPVTNLTITPVESRDK